MTFFIAAVTIACAGLAAFLVAWGRDARAARRAEDERVITGIGLILAIPPATNLAAPPAVNATQPAAASPVTGTPSTPDAPGPASPPPIRVHIARSPLLPRRSHAAPRIFEPVTVELPRPRWTQVPTRAFLLVAPTAERRRELVNA